MTQISIQLSSFLSVSVSGDRMIVCMSSMKLCVSEVEVEMVGFQHDLRKEKMLS